MSEQKEGKIIKGLRFKASNGFTTTKERSALMSKIKSNNTIAEKVMRKALWQRGIKYRKNVTSLPGKPDIVIRKDKIVIFTDGEFWHSYNWEIKKLKIKANRDFWIPKIERNIQRDKTHNEALKEMGFTVVRFWEKEIKKNLEKCVTDILLLIPTPPKGP